MALVGCTMTCGGRALLRRTCLLCWSRRVVGHVTRAPKAGDERQTADCASNEL